MKKPKPPIGWVDSKDDPLLARMKPEHRKDVKIYKPAPKPKNNTTK